MEDHITDEIKAAYADAGPQREDDAYTHNMRCLSFLTSGWVTPEQAADAVEYIGEYNAFEPETVAEYLSEIAEADPDALVAIGREGLPVLYVETDEPEPVKSILNGQKINDDAKSPWGRASPDELGGVEPGAVGSARKDLYGDGDDQIDAHQTCTHAAPPVPVSEYAKPDPERSHIRAWWD